MAIKYCHRCLMKFNCNIRLIMHLTKQKKCFISNDKYNHLYEEKLMSHINNFIMNFESETILYIKKIQKIYECKLCKYQAPNKYEVKRHLMKSCSQKKWIIDNQLKELIDNSQKPELYLLNNSPIKKLDSPVNDKPSSPINIKPTISSFYNDYIKLIEIKDNPNNYLYQCECCSIFYSNKIDIYDHVNETHLDKNNLINSLKEMKAEIKNMNSKIESHVNEVKEIKPIINQIDSQVQEIKKIKPTINHNYNKLKIYLHENGDTLKLLHERTGDFQGSLEFLKDCALSDLSGDIRIIDALYLQGEEPAIFYVDLKKKQLVWKDEDGQIYPDKDGLVGRKLARNLQNGYLNGANYLTKQVMDLADHDIEMWNNHIYKFADTRYQKKLISYSRIPSIKTKIIH